MFLDVKSNWTLVFSKSKKSVGQCYFGTWVLTKILKHKFHDLVLLVASKWALDQGVGRSGDECHFARFKLARTSLERAASHELVLGSRTDIQRNKLMLAFLSLPLWLLPSHDDCFAS